MPTVSRSAPEPQPPTEPVAHWPPQWLRLESAAAPGLDNMAMDLALLHAAASRGAAVLRTYRWTRPTVSFGRNEVVRGVWDVAAMEAQGLDVVRRPTGGRALLHTREVTYSVTMPWPAGRRWREAYDAVNRRLLGALVALGVPARLHHSGGTPALSPDGPACFASPSAGEVVTDAGKVAGSAVWRSHDGYLQHGSILLHDDQAMLAAFRHAPHSDDATAAAPISTWLRAADDEALSARVIGALHAAWGDPDRDTIPVTSSAVDLPTVNECRAMLSSPHWLWRR